MTYFLSTGYDDPWKPTFYIDWGTGKTYNVDAKTREMSYNDNYYERDTLNKHEVGTLLKFAERNEVPSGDAEIEEDW